MVFLFLAQFNLFLYTAIMYVINEYEKTSLQPHGIIGF
jgi:hypothetical protein